MDFQVFSFVPTESCPVSDQHWGELGSPILVPTHQVLTGVDTIPLSLLQPKPPPWWPCTDLAPLSPHPSHWEPSTTRSTLDVSHRAEQRKDRL